MRKQGDTSRIDLSKISKFEREDLINNILKKAENYHKKVQFIDNEDAEYEYYNGGARYREMDSINEGYK